MGQRQELPLIRSELSDEAGCFPSAGLTGITSRPMVRVRALSCGQLQQLHDIALARNSRHISVMR